MSTNIKNDLGIIPWSATRERSARWQKTVASVLMVASGGTLCVGVVLINSTLMIGACIAGLLTWAWQGIAEQYLEAVLHNRPGNSRGFAQPHTSWIAHAGGTQEFACACGAPNTFTGKALLPNSVDPHGGRYVVHCRCGIGHYKIAGANTQPQAGSEIWN